MSQYERNGKIFYYETQDDLHRVDDTFNKIAYMRVDVVVKKMEPVFWLGICDLYETIFYETCSSCEVDNNIVVYGDSTERIKKMQSIIDDINKKYIHCHSNSGYTTD